MDAQERATALAAYRAAVDYIDREVVRLEPRRRDPAGKVRAVRDFLARLGDPQRRYPSIQVAGTSGKGGVCWFLANALHAAGLRTGLHVSPYLQAFTEKTWIDGRYADPSALADAVETLRPVAEAFRADPDCPASVHGMASLASSYLLFARARLDVAVMETGVGGRFDLVQGLRRALSVITDLGFDHPHCLGGTQESIAWHKAGIMEEGVPCVAVRGLGWGVLAAEAQRLGVELVGVRPESLLKSSRRDGAGQRAELELPRLGRVELRLRGQAPFLLRNACLAAAALDRLAGAGWPLRAEHLAEGCARPLLPGRWEQVQERPRVILDGAHNPQKLDALLRALEAGGATGGQLVVVLAATGQRLPEDALARLGPASRLLVLTQPRLYGKRVVPADELGAAARRLGFACRVVPEPLAAVEAAIAAAGPRGAVLVTGSLYLLGQVRARWFPTDEVILQGSSWPREPSASLDGSQTPP